MKTIELSRGLVALVDEEDYPALSTFKWSASGNRKYAVRWAAGRMVYMHRAILPGVAEVDHINGNGLDNRRENLRAASHSANNQNKCKTKANKSGYKGVNWHRGAGKWTAAIRAGADRYYLGLFHDVEEAARAYDEAARRLHGEFAALNFPEDGEAAA